MNDYTIRVVDDLPVDGMIMESPDGHANIYISGKLSGDRQRKVTMHELAHLQCGHLHKDGSVADMEREANEKSGDFRDEEWQTINVSTKHI